MTTVIPSDATLILIDVQHAFDNADFWGKRNNPEAEANMARILKAWRETNRPVIHIQQISKNPESLFYPGTPTCEFKPEVTPLPDEVVIPKYPNSAFIGTDLEERLRRDNISTVVIFGLTTNHCVSTTSRMAGNFGFNVYVVADASATFERVGHDGRHYTAEQLHDVSLASLHGEFATVLETEDLLRMVEVTV